MTDPVTPAQDRRFCPLCGKWSKAFRPDGLGNPNRGCPHCRSLERHRFLALLLPALVSSANAGVVLDIAPTTTLAGLIDRLVPRRVGIDFDPSADGRTVTCRASLTHLPLPDASIDLALCSHVLEHIPDDLAAMRELARVLAPGGTGVVAVPHRRGRPTEEDPSASTSERVRRFGQADHVRYYGDDFAARLRASGLAEESFTPVQLLPAAVVRTCALMPHETFWLVRPASAATVDFARQDLEAVVLGQLMQQFAAADAHHVSVRAGRRSSIGWRVLRRVRRAARR